MFKYWIDVFWAPEADERTEASGQTIGPAPPAACSGHLPMVEAQQSAEALPAVDRASLCAIGWRLDEPPIEALVVIYKNSIVAFQAAFRW